MAYRRRTKKKKQPELELAKFLRSLSSVYLNSATGIGDSSAPGLVLSYLPKTGEFYAAVNRYTGTMGTGRVVLNTAKAGTLRESLQRVIALYEGREPADAENDL